ncbi:hypothetical protein HAX54_001072, partial [Datura stramonium]|nr:hypothetical protein [Datura stramonium]
SPNGGPPVVLRESPVISRIDLPNIACWHKSVRFGLERMEEYYVAFRERQSIHAEAQFENLVWELYSSYKAMDPKTQGPHRNITMPTKVKDKANQFQWVANMIAIGQPQWTISRGLIHCPDLKFEACMLLDFVCA